MGKKGSVSDFVHNKAKGQNKVPLEVVVARAFSVEVLRVIRMPNGLTEPFFQGVRKKLNMQLILCIKMGVGLSRTLKESPEKGKHTLCPSFNSTLFLNAYYYSRVKRRRGRG